jgi:hypothetical protein
MKLYPYIFAPITVALFRIIAVMVSFFMNVSIMVMLMPVIKGVAILALGLALISPVQYIATETYSYFWAMGLLEYAKTPGELAQPKVNNISEAIGETITVIICLLSVCLL